MFLVNNGYFEGPQFSSYSKENKIFINDGEFHNINLYEYIDTDNPEYQGFIEAKGGKFYESSVSPNFTSILADGYAVIDENGEFIDLKFRYLPYFEIIEHTHTLEWVVSNEGHYLACQCGYTDGEVEVIPHSGGSANCSELAVCETCSASYGELNNTVHLEEKELVPMREASCTNIGYDAHYRCACGTVFDLEGNEISLEDISTEAIGHKINDQLVCENCGEDTPYYAITADGTRPFGSVEELIDFMNSVASDEVKVVLNQDINLDYYEIVYVSNNVVLTYDLNGHLSNNISFQVDSYNAIFKLIDSSAEKTGLLKSTKLAHPIYAYYGTTIIEASVHGQLYTSDTVIVNGGTFTANSSEVMVLGITANVTINGGTFVSNTINDYDDGSLVINGGTFTAGLTLNADNYDLFDVLPNTCYAYVDEDGNSITLADSNAITTYFKVVHVAVETVDAAKAPPCEETGLTEGKHCSVCNEVLVA